MIILIRECWWCHCTIVAMVWVNISYVKPEPMHTQLFCDIAVCRKFYYSALVVVFFLSVFFCFVRLISMGAGKSCSLLFTYFAISTSTRILALKTVFYHGFWHSTHVRGRLFGESVTHLTIFAFSTWGKCPLLMPYCWYSARCSYLLVTVANASSAVNVHTVLEQNG